MIPLFGRFVLANERIREEKNCNRVLKPQCPKGQIISECPYEKMVYPKTTTKKFPRFLPWPLRRGQIKNFIKPIMLNNP